MDKFITTRKVVPINDVVPNPWNPNVESKVVYESIKKTIEQKGMIGSITVRETAGCYQIINGEHRWKILKELNYKEIPVDSMGEISDEDAYFWTLKLNEGGKNDLEKLAKMYEEMSGDQLSLLGTTQDEIENTKSLMKFDFSQYETSEPELEADIMAHIFALKFNSEEWKVVQEALSEAKKDSQTDKQWFMLQIKSYLRAKGILSGFE